MSRQIVKNEKSRSEMKIGIDTNVDEVKITIGPRGRNVAFVDEYDDVLISNDGKEISEAVTDLDDPVQNMGNTLVKKLGRKINAVAGGARSTCLLLYQATITEGMKYLSSGISSPHLRVAIENATEDAVKILETLSVKANGKDDLEKVATISGESKVIGKIVAEMIEKVGENGRVTTQESSKLGIEPEIVEGLMMDKGYISQYMITDSDRMEAEFQDPYILVTDKRISSFADITPIMQKVAKTTATGLVIICDDLTDEALGAVLINKLRGGLAVLAIRTPGYGEAKQEWLGDIAALTGAKLITKSFEKPLINLELNDLGRAGTVTSTVAETQILGNGDEKDIVENRVRQLKAERNSLKNEHQIERLDERIARLSGGIGVIRVGSLSDTMVKHKRAKVSDAVASAKGALAEGMLPGGGTALIRVAEQLELLVKESKMENEEKLGYEIVIKALYSLLRQIVANCGGQDASAIIEKIKVTGQNAGYDAVKNVVVEDMIEAGIADDIRSIRYAIQFALTEAAIFLTVEVANAKVQPKK